MSDAGQYRRRIQLLQPIDTPNGSGGFNRSYVVASGCSSVPAKITYPPPSKKGDEQYSQQQVRSSLFATIAIRYRPSLNIDASWRVGYGTRNFEIRTIFIPDEYSQEITMQVEELQAQGDKH